MFESCLSACDCSPCSYLQAVSIAALRAVLHLNTVAREFSFAVASVSSSLAAFQAAEPLLPIATLKAHVDLMVQAMNTHLFDADSQQFVFAYDRTSGVIALDQRVVWGESLTALAFLERDDLAPRTAAAIMDFVAPRLATAEGFLVWTFSAQLSVVPLQQSGTQDKPVRTPRLHRGLLAVRANLRRKFGRAVAASHVEADLHTANLHSALSANQAEPHRLVKPAPHISDSEAAALRALPVHSKNLGALGGSVASVPRRSLEEAVRALAVARDQTEIARDGRHAISTMEQTRVLSPVSQVLWYSVELLFRMCAEFLRVYSGAHSHGRPGTSPARSARSNVAVSRHGHARTQCERPYALVFCSRSRFGDCGYRRGRLGRSFSWQGWHSETHHHHEFRLAFSVGQGARAKTSHPRHCNVAVRTDRPRFQFSAFASEAARCG